MVAIVSDVALSAHSIHSSDASRSGGKGFTLPASPSPVGYRNDTKSPHSGGTLRSRASTSDISKKRFMSQAQAQYPQW